jgi:outer membrane protein OmpU
VRPGRLLFGTGALGFCLAGSGAPGAAGEAEVRGGGALELTVTGFVGVLAHGGALDEQREDPDYSRGLDFSNDTEVHVLARGRSEEHGLEYGATVEFEADTDETFNTDETWLFLNGGWGEVRFGDEDGPADASALGAYTIAAGTGGIDGDVVDALAVDAVLPTNSDDATKIRYYTPSFGGFQFGLSYTPNADDGGATLAATDAEFQGWVEAAAVHEGEVAGAETQASLVGGVGRVDDGGTDDDRLWTWYAGAAAYLPAVEVGAGYGQEDVGGERRGYANVGAGRKLGPVYASVNHGRVLDTAGYAGVGRPWNLVFSADAELLPGLVLAGDAGYFDNDLDREARDATGGDRGWVWVTRLELAF